MVVSLGHSSLSNPVSHFFDMNISWQALNAKPSSLRFYAGNIALHSKAVWKIGTCTICMWKNPSQLHFAGVYYCKLCKCKRLFICWCLAVERFFIIWIHYSSYGDLWSLLTAKAGQTEFLICKVIYYEVGSFKPWAYKSHLDSVTIFKCVLKEGFEKNLLKVECMHAVRLTGVSVDSSPTF